MTNTIECLISRLDQIDFETRLDVIPRAGEHIFVNDRRFEVCQVQHRFDETPTIRIVCGGDIS